jgi:DNA mismatch repair protein MutS
MSLIKEYFELTKQYQTDYGISTILLMQVGSFFEVYGFLDKKTGTISGSNIEDFSRICDLNIVEKNVCISTNNIVGEKDVVMAGFKDFQIEKYVKKIQEAGFTSVVYTQDEAAKNTTRSCAGIFSPGTYFSNDSTYLTNNIICIWVDLVVNKLLIKGKHIVVGVANIDVYTGKSNLFQYQESYTNNPTDYDQLEHFISIYHPNEVILISNLNDVEMDNVINYANIQCNSIHKLSLVDNNIVGRSDENKKNQFIQKAKNCEKQIYQKEILTKFYKTEDYNVFSQPFYENNITAQAFCFLLDFVFQHNPYLVNKISEPVFENTSERLLLANHSLKQLNIIETRENNYSGKYSSVLKMLNHCYTPMGKRKFAQQFLSPTTNTFYLQKEYDITEYILSNFDSFSYLWRQKLSEIKDLSKWERQLFLKKISPKSLYGLQCGISLAKELFEGIQKNETIMDYLQSVEAKISKVQEYCENILGYLSQTIHTELAKEIDQTQGFETNFIQKGIDSELDLKTASISVSECKLEAIQNYLSQLIENKEKKGKTNDYVKIHETEKNSFSLITTNRRCKLLQDALPQSSTWVQLYYNLGSSSSEKSENCYFDFQVSKTQFEFPKQSATNCFICDEQISQLCKTISSIKISMKEIITKVFYQLIEKFGQQYHKQLETIIHFITLIDVLYAKASIAKKYNYCKPTLVESDKSFVRAQSLRHCLIEYLQTNENYVTNNIELGNGTVDGILLYGTNAVGKTSLIRALGISLVMAQSGLFVPCSQFVYKPYQYIFTRIIGNDNLFKGLSTFAVEMSELRTILRLTNENSLVLGDELCSGTENSSAISIFVAGIQRLQKAKSSFIFATHLHEIVNYDEIRELTNVVLKHMSVIYNKELDILVYDRKLKDGPGNNMYGLEVCKSLNLPADFIENAYQIRMKYNPDSASLLSLKTSHYNAKKIMGNCEKCGINIGTEVHHLQHQKNANENGIIENNNAVFHKNHLSNLITLCESCHQEFHKQKTQHKKVKTSKGYKLEAIN